MSAFSLISLRLKEMYQMITLGGDAELELVDTCDPFAEGILFQVRPPKKSWKNIANLSGGEKTLSSLALVFALHHYKPTPLYVMDEIDAALDFKNVSIVANYIKERTRDAQFVIISLRNNMFELADRLVGIYKTHDVTKSVTINPKRIAAECAAAAAADAAAVDGGADASEDVPPEGAAAMPGAGKGAAAAGAGAASSTTVGLPLGSRAANLS
jgi:structural maintenance of chromosome 4